MVTKIQLTSILTSWVNLNGRRHLIVTEYGNINQKGYFKFLYQLYFHNSKVPALYKIYPDSITNPIQSNVDFELLKRCLNAGLRKKFLKILNPTDIPPNGNFVQAIIPVNSKTTQCIQAVDVILGAIGYL